MRKSEIEKASKEFSELETVRTDSLSERPATIGLNNVGGIDAFRAGCLRGHRSGYLLALSHIKEWVQYNSFRDGNPAYMEFKQKLYEYLTVEEEEKTDEKA